MNTSPTASVTREQLYEQVWAEPMVTVAARYDVSGSFLARVCADLNVPRPPRGYWAQLEVGKAPPRPPLPEPAAGDTLEWSRGGPVRRRVVIPRPPGPNATRRSGRFGPRPTRHALVSGVREHFEAGRVSDAGYLRPRKRILVDIFVSKPLLARALDLASGLFLTLEDQGRNVRLLPLTQFCRPELHTRPGHRLDDYRHPAWSPDRATIVSFGTVAIGLSIYEVSEEAEFRYVKGDYVRVSELPARRRPYDDTYNWISKRETGSGRLAVRAYSPYLGTAWTQEWIEAKPGDLATKFSAIRKGLETAAPLIVPMVEEAQRKRDEASRLWAAQCQEWDRKELLRKQREARETSQAELISIIQAWTEACHIESFFEDALHRSERLPPSERAAIATRIAAARDMLGDSSALTRFAGWQSPSQRLGARDADDDTA